MLAPNEKLRLHLWLNRCSNVYAEKIALTSGEGDSEFFIASNGFEGFSSLRPPDIDASIRPTRVRITRLDSYLREHSVETVDLIKVDVEGGELDVFKGAENLLRGRMRPVILCELQDVRTRPWGHTARDTFSFLQSFGFQWFRPMLDGSLLRVSENSLLYESNLVAVPEERMGQIASWDQPYDTLRKKWVNVPVTTFDRMKTTELLALSDELLLDQWEKAREDITMGPGFAHRGWYHTLYAESMHGKKVMDVGSGFGVDSITFAQHGAKVTFVDLVGTNLDVLKRLCKIMGLSDVRFQVLQDVDSLQSLDTDYDVIMAMGSLHNAPMQVMKPEYQELVRHLKLGGRWLQLAYPEVRWVREGRLPFSEWGEITDGAGTPWCEPLDVPKLLNMLEPAKFDVVLYQEFHNGDFNWFDLLYRGM